MATRRKISAEAKTIGEILQGAVKFSVPANQRDFAWRADEQVEAICDDLTTALDEGREEYFLGAVVVRPTDQKNAFEIVDGQQRMTALSMMFAAISEFWGDDDRATEVSEAYLGSKDRRSRETIPKLTLNETNNPVFEAVVLKHVPVAQFLSRPKTNQLLISAYQKIKEKLHRWSSSQSSFEDAIIALEDFIAKNANLIVIEVGDESDAFIIFETLNDRGLDLAVSDLVKNYLFSIAGTNIDFFKKGWSDVSQAVGSENMTAFLRHFWLSEHELLRERELYRKLRDTVKGPTKPKTFIVRLQQAAEHYAALTSPEHPYWGSVPGSPQQHVRALRLLRATQFRPLALAVMDGGTEAEVMSMLRIVLTISLRYIVSGASANELERAYSTAAIQVRKTNKRNAQTLKEFLKAIYVSDDDFMRSFSEYTFNKADLARYVLGELNAELETDKAVSVADDASLEHILPRKPGSGWPTVPPADELSSWVEQIGNLTLLEKGINNKLGNKDFEQKKAQGFQPSKLAINNDLKLTSSWTTADIAARSAALSELARRRWRLD